MDENGSLNTRGIQIEKKKEKEKKKHWVHVLYLHPFLIGAGSIEWSCMNSGSLFVFRVHGFCT